MQDDIKQPPPASPQPTVQPPPAAAAPAQPPAPATKALPPTQAASKKPARSTPKTEHHFIPIIIAILILVFLAAVAILGDKSINP